MRSGIKLLIVVVISSSLIIFLNNATKDVVAAKEKQKELAVISKMLNRDADIEYKTKENINENIIKKYDIATGEKIYKIKTFGYGGEIISIVALDEKGSVIGLDVLSNYETPGIGSRVFENDNLSKMYKGQIDSLSGATITSEAIKKSINIAIKGE